MLEDAAPVAAAKGKPLQTPQPNFAIEFADHYP
jgi:hypothetical protein